MSRGLVELSTRAHIHEGWYLLVAAIIEQLALLDCMTDQGRYHLIARVSMIDVPKLEVLRNSKFWLRGQNAPTQRE